MTTAAVLPFTEVDVPATRALQIVAHCGPEFGAISTVTEEAFGVLMGFAGAHGLPPSGPPRAIYSSMGPDGTTFTLALPISAEASVDLDDRVFADVLPAMRAMRFEHHGPYSELSRTYADIESTLKAKGLLESPADWARFAPTWEEYLSDPACTPPADLVTNIYIPLPPKA